MLLKEKARLNVKLKRNEKSNEKKKNIWIKIMGKKIWKYIVGFFAGTYWVECTCCFFEVVKVLVERDEKFKGKIKN